MHAYPCGIIEQRPPQPPIVEDKTEGLDQVELDAETGGKAQQRPGILRNVGFEQSQAQIVDPGRLRKCRSRYTERALIRRRCRFMRQSVA